MTRLTQLRATVAMIVGIGLASSPALATFPGENGRIVYVVGLDLNTANFRNALFVTASGQLTFPRGEYPAIQTDRFPAWSPDGSKVAFVRFDYVGPKFSLMVIGKDGTDLRTIASSDLFPSGANFSSPSWSPDGQRIAFMVRYPPGSFESYTGIWIFHLAGSGASQLVRDPSPTSANWSPSTNEIVYACKSPNGRVDLCIVDASTRVIRRLTIAPPGVLATALQAARDPKWSSDGRTIVFAYEFHDDQIVHRSEIFSIGSDGTGLERITHSPGACRRDDLPGVWEASPQYKAPAPSPDGAWIVAEAVQWNGTADRCTSVGGGGLQIVGMQTGDSSVLVADDTLSSSGAPYHLVSQPDWQPISGNLAVTIEDGYGHHLDGLKVELRTPDGTPVHGRPFNAAGGRYVFEEPIPPAEYVVRATLIDDAGEPGSTPAFDIRHAGTFADPAWIEHGLTITDAAGTDLTIPFEEGPALLDTNVLDRSRLDDLANIYFRVRQYVDWVKTHLIADTGPTVEFYTFAMVDPWDGSDYPQVHHAYYVTSQTAAVMSVLESEYENRDGVTGEKVLVDDAGIQIQGHDDSGPENSEWHEFTHHLYAMFVTTGASCEMGSESHAGYDNPDTCDSMDEGFASFLPMLAALDIEEQPDDHYDHQAYNFDHVKFKPWGYFDPWLWSFGEVMDVTTEEYAVAGLFWDLVDAKEDYVGANIIGADGTHRGVVHRDQVSIHLRKIWAQLRTHDPDTGIPRATVFDLRKSFGTLTPTLDLDLDGVMDITPIDVVFLLHGFFPIESDQTITDQHKTYHYDVAYAQRRDPSAPRNSAVGLSSHVVYDASGAETRYLVPRRKIPAQRRANLEIHVLDASGFPVAGATLGMTLRYAGGSETTIRRQLSTGDGAHVHLELPPYFDYLLPSGASLPACDPVHDFRVEVVLSASVGDVVSTETPSFDNCTYQRAMANATGSTALSFTLTVPVIGAVTHTLTLDSDGTGSGAVTGGGTYRDGETAVVSATADAGSTLTGWGGPDAAECATGSVLMTADKSCTAGFTLITHALTLLATGSGSGTVAGGGIYNDGQTALVSATADAGSTFTGWSGPDAAECATGSVLVTADKSCTAGFTLITHALTLLATGSGSGSVAGGGIYNDGQTALVSATADAGSTFTGWSGPDAAECATGSVLVTADKSCTASFALNTSYSFSGFFQPVDNPPSLNSVNAGSAVPVKFSLGGNRGLNIFAVGFPASGAMSCSATAPVDEIESTVTAGGSGLTYDPTTDQYTYVWKTDKSWAGQCRQLFVRLDDGSSHVGNFKLR